MYQTLECLALRTVRYDDRRSIVAAWSRQLGRLSLAVPDGSGREARRRRALMMPLSLFAGEVDIRPGRDIHAIRDVRPLAVAAETASDPAKSVVALFLAEALERLLRIPAADETLTAFIFDAVGRLNRLGSAAAVANFPIIFLSRLAAYLGIAPDPKQWRPGSWLDLMEGIYRSTPPMSGPYLDPAQSAVAAMVGRLGFDSGRRLRLPRPLRREILDRILEYYTLHYTRLDNLNSLPVVKDIF